MTYKKTFWMNVVLAVFFVLLMLLLQYPHFRTLSKEGFDGLFEFNIFYLCYIAPLVVIISASALFTSKNITLAKALHILQLLFVCVLAVYAFTEPKNMDKKIVRGGLKVLLFIYVIPSIINIRALKKLSAKAS